MFSRNFITGRLKDMIDKQHTVGQDQFIIEGISGCYSWKNSRISGNKGNSTKNMCMCVLVGKIRDYYLVL